MPTPIQHLVMAQQVLTSPALPPATRARLDVDVAVRGAFFFGHIAPDVQVVSRQPRESTHFFTLPLTQAGLVYRQMFIAHPHLAQPDALLPAHATFVAGYISHLLLDEAWIREIFQPIFGPEQNWGDWHERLLLHNVLRAWLDQRDIARMPEAVGDLLRHARPDHWLPFAADADLRRWRDLVADQFAPGANIRTVEIFARRARIPDAAFAALLDPDIMAARIFARISPAELDAFHDRVLNRICCLTVDYFAR